MRRESSSIYQIGVAFICEHWLWIHIKIWLFITGVQADNAGVGSAFAGDHITLTVSGVDPNVLHAGDFICDPMNQIPQVTKIQARIVVFNIVVPLIKGSQVIMLNIFLVKYYN